MYVQTIKWTKLHSQCKWSKLKSLLNPPHTKKGDSNNKFGINDYVIEYDIDTPTGIKVDDKILRHENIQFLSKLSAFKVRKNALCMMIRDV